MKREDKNTINNAVIDMTDATEELVLNKARIAFYSLFRSISGGKKLSNSAYMVKNRDDLMQTTMASYVEGFKHYCVQNGLDINKLTKKQMNEAGGCAYRRAEWAIKDQIRAELDNPMNLSRRGVCCDNAIEKFFESRNIAVTYELCESDINMLRRLMDVSSAEDVKFKIMDYMVRHEEGFILPLDNQIDVSYDAQYDDEAKDGCSIGLMRYESVESVVTTPISPAKREKQIAVSCNHEVNSLLKDCKTLTQTERAFLVDYFGLHGKKKLSERKIQVKYKTKCNKMLNRALNKLKKFYDDQGITNLCDLL